MFHYHSMHAPRTSIWSQAPALAIPDVPALFADSRDLWLAYAVAETSAVTYAIIHFIHVIDHRLSPINDEGIGKHPYAKAGLKWYSFNEITGSHETLQWSVLKARHWVVTFKDNTLDVIAEDAKVVAAGLQASDPRAALLSYLQNAQG